METWRGRGGGPSGWEETGASLSNRSGVGAGDLVGAAGCRLRVVDRAAGARSLRARGRTSPRRCLMNRFPTVLASLLLGLIVACQGNAQRAPTPDDTPNLGTVKQAVCDDSEQCMHIDYC